MFDQMSIEPESKNWFAGWNSPREMPPRANHAEKRSIAASTRRVSEASRRAEAQSAEDWASECLFEHYNPYAL